MCLLFIISVHYLQIVYEEQSFDTQPVGLLIYVLNKSRYFQMLQNHGQWLA